jgi:hypothetical protein
MRQTDATPDPGVEANAPLTGSIAGVLRYYTGDWRFRIAGRPRVLARLLCPVSVLLTIVVFGTGLELWLFGYRFGFVWAPLHHASLPVPTPFALPSGGG